MTTMKGRRETTSIYLRPGVLEALRDLSEKTDIPVAHYLREAVDDLLAKHDIRVAEGRAVKMRGSRKGQR
jgi:predicted DNA-binding protein